MPQVDHKHPLLVEREPVYTLVNDCTAGPAAVKAKKEVYLPRPDPSDTSPANNKRYDSYVQRAQFLGAPGKTREGLVGQVFAKEPVVTLPKPMELLIDDVDAAGVGLDQQAKESLRQVLGTGRCGLLVDYPQSGELINAPKNEDGTPRELSKADVELLGLRPRINVYEAPRIINWRTQSVSGRPLLVMVVLEEQAAAEDDGFEIKTERSYRVLRLNIKPGEEVFYYQEVWKKSDTSNSTFELVSTARPVDGWGKSFSQIPFFFIGWADNSATPNSAPLEALCHVTIGHYINSADFEESCYITGQPTPVFAGLTEEWVKDTMKGVVRLGSRGGIPLPVGATFGLLQASPNNLPFEAMKHKEKQMVSLGGEMVEEKQVQQTATQSSIEATSKGSILGSSATNVSKGYEAALKVVARFMKIELPEDDSIEEVLSYELNTDFEISRMAPDERRQLLAEWQGGAISFAEYRWNLVKAGVAYLDDEAVKDQIQTEMSSATGTHAHEEEEQDIEEEQQPTED